MCSADGPEVTRETRRTAQACQGSETVCVCVCVCACVRVHVHAFVCAGVHAC